MKTLSTSTTMTAVVIHVISNDARDGPVYPQLRL